MRYECPRVRRDNVYGTKNVPHPGLDEGCIPIPASSNPEAPYRAATLAAMEAMPRKPILNCGSRSAIGGAASPGVCQRWANVRRKVRFVEPAGKVA